MVCPICHTPLIGRQKAACSGKHRAELSRRRKLAEATAPLERTLRTLLTRVEEAAEEAKKVLAGRGEDSA